MRWRDEIIELHDLFQAYFLGQEDSLDRVASALHPDFTIVGPDGSESDRDTTMAMLERAHGGLASFELTTLDHRLLHATEETVVASYVEAQRRPEGPNRRSSTVVFAVDAHGPNGVRWLRVHETWLPAEEIPNAAPAGRD